MLCLPEVTLQEQATVAEIGRTSQTTSDLPVLLHDLHHLTHGCGEKYTMFSAIYTKDQNYHVVHHYLFHDLFLCGWALAINNENI